MRRVAVMVVVLLSVLGLAGTARAGGPTSVLLASPTLQKAAALYNTGGDYARLAEAVGVQRSFPADPNVPSRLGVGPGSGAINLTWLIHDVLIWRVDRVHIEGDGSVWVNTTVSEDHGVLPLDRGGVWHRPAQPKQLVALLTKLGVWDGVGSKRADPENAIVTGGDDAAPSAQEPAQEPAQKPAPAAATTTSTAPRGPSPWQFAGIGLLGAALGLAVRPALGLAARWRTRGPRQQLIDA